MGLVVRWSRVNPTGTDDQETQASRAMAYRFSKAEASAILASRTWKYLSTEARSVGVRRDRGREAWDQGVSLGLISCFM